MVNSVTQSPFNCDRDVLELVRGVSWVFLSSFRQISLYIPLYVCVNSQVLALFVNLSKSDLSAKEGRRNLSECDLSV